MMNSMLKNKHIPARISAAPLLERAEALLYPRRCPFCGAVLGGGQAHRLASCICAGCAPKAAKLEHKPPRLPETEHCFYSVSGAAAAYYYADEVRAAILRCKQYANPWYARELADLMAVRIFGAEPAARPGARPRYLNISGIPPYTMVVAVPPRRNTGRGFTMPGLMAKRLADILDVPLAAPLRVTRPIKEQKALDREQRLQNTRGAYAALPGADLLGQRVLIVDDIITTGATVSACAMALLQAGAVEVFAVCAAADELRKKE